MASNFPPGYSEDGDAATHGNQLAIYQELVKIRVAFEKWTVSNQKDFPSDEFKARGVDIERAFEDMEAELNQPL